MRILIIGCGWAGQRHIVNLKNLGQDNILTQDINLGCRRKVEKKFGLRSYERLADCFQEHIDFVVIATPSSSHISIAIECAKHGCHLFVEKPLSHNLDGLEELKQLVEEHSLKVMIGYNWRYHPSLLKMKQIIRSGVLGRIFGARLIVGQYLPDWHPHEDYRKTYMAQKDLGGGILNGLHELDHLTWFLGDIKRAVCFFGKLSSLKIETEDTLSMILELKTGTIANIHADYLQRSWKRTYEIHGEKGSVFWDHDWNLVKYYTSQTNAWNFFYNRDFKLNDTYVNELKDFIGSIQEDLSFSGCSFREAAKLVQIVNAFKQKGEFYEK